MQKHANRHLVAAVLIAAGVLGGFFVFLTHRRAAAVEAAATADTTRIDRMAAAVQDIAAAQQGYVAPGQPEQPWIERSAALLHQFGEDSGALSRTLRSSDAPASINRMDHEFKVVVAIDARARRDLEQGQTLLATDLIFSEGRETIAMLASTLRNLRSAEQVAADAERASIDHQQWSVLALVLMIWMGGIIGLAAAPPAAVTSPAQAAELGVEHVPASDTITSLDLGAAADVCGGLARAADTPALNGVLARLAAVLDAHGVIVWMGAGDQLFPALAHGYDRRLLERMGPIARTAANATAEAWRTGELRVVAADPMSHGALAAPLVGVNGCVGVLAAEVRHGREQDPGTRAVVAMFAAQLSGMVSAWPAASGSNMADSGPIAASGN